MKKEIRDTKEKLYRESIRLRELSNVIPGDKGFELREKQSDMYNRWKFYSNILKANDKIK